MKGEGTNLGITGDLHCWQD